MNWEYRFGEARGDSERRVETVCIRERLKRKRCVLQVAVVAGSLVRLEDPRNELRAQGLLHEKRSIRRECFDDFQAARLDVSSPANVVYRQGAHLPPPDT